MSFELQNIGQLSGNNNVPFIYGFNICIINNRRILNKLRLELELYSPSTTDHSYLYIHPFSSI